MNFMERKCKKCLGIKSVNLFSTKISRGRTYYGVCKKCSSEQRKQYYENNKDTILKRQRVYDENNKERFKERKEKTSKQWQKNNKEKKKGYTKKWREKNKIRFMEKRNAWRKANKEKVKEHDRLKKKKIIKNMTICYLGNCLRISPKILKEHPEIIEAKRIQLIGLRKLKELINNKK